MANKAVFSRAIFLVASFVCGMRAGAQSALSPVDPAISRLASHIAEPVQQAKATKVIVANLRGPDWENRSLGVWLADQISLSLQQNFSTLVVVDRPQLAAIVDDNKGPTSQTLVYQAAKKRARSLGARVVIVGSFARIPQGIGITLVALNASDLGGQLGETNGVVPLSDEMTAMSPEPIPAAKEGIARAGVGGTTSPRCTHCPNPQYSDAARSEKYQGDVSLQVVVNAEGRVDKVVVIKGPGKGLEEAAVRAVRGWRFKPAMDVDGKPVSVVCPIEITFRLY